MNAATGLSAVFVEESTCGDTQYLKVHNERVSSAKYQGYSCAIDLFIPQPIRASVVPVSFLLHGKRLSVTTDTVMSIENQPPVLL